MVFSFLSLITHQTVRISTHSRLLSFIGIIIWSAIFLVKIGEIVKTASTFFPNLRIYHLFGKNIIISYFFLRVCPRGSGSPPLRSSQKVHQESYSAVLQIAKSSQYGVWILSGSSQLLMFHPPSFFFKGTQKGHVERLRAHS